MQAPMSIDVNKGSDSLSMQFDVGRHAWRTRRARRRSRGARPYICRLTSLSLVIWLSVCPFDHSSVSAAVTTDKSAAMPFPNDASMLMIISVSGRGGVHLAPRTSAGGVELVGGPKRVHGKWLQVYDEAGCNPLSRSRATGYGRRRYRCLSPQPTELRPLSRGCCERLNVRDDAHSGQSLASH